MVVRLCDSEILAAAKASPALKEMFVLIGGIMKTVQGNPLFSFTKPKMFQENKW